jgi:hypothetical protein
MSMAKVIGAAAKLIDPTTAHAEIDGKTYIELNDSHISGAGAIGMWTKADSVTAFDDFAFQARP